MVGGGVGPILLKVANNSASALPNAIMRMNEAVSALCIPVRVTLKQQAFIEGAFWRMLGRGKAAILK